MNKMVLLLSRLMTKELLTVHVEEALVAYKTLPTDSAWDRLALACTLIALKKASDHSDVEQVLKDLDDNPPEFLSASAN